MFLHSDRSLLQTVRVFFLIFQIVLKVFLFPIWSVLPSFSTSETSVLILEKFVYEPRIDGYDEIRDFKVKSNFDKFFENHRNLYEVMIEDIVTILIESEFNKWLETFYGYKIKENKCVYVSFLTGGGNFGLSIYNSKGTPIPHIVVYAGETKNMYLYLISHEFLHPCTLKM